VVYIVCLQLNIKHYVLPQKITVLKLNKTNIKVNKWPNCYNTISDNKLINPFRR